VTTFGFRVKNSAKDLGSRAKIVTTVFAFPIQEIRREQLTDKSGIKIPLGWIGQASPSFISYERCQDISYSQCDVSGLQFVSVLAERVLF